jgi:hypothetical protein
MTVLQRLLWMRSVDRNRVEFGASDHGYALSAPVGEQDLLALESANGFRFPPTLRDFWLHAGAAGAGPGLGIYGPAETRHFRPMEQFTEIDELRRRGDTRVALVGKRKLAALEISFGLRAGSGRFEDLVAAAAAQGIALPSPRPSTADSYFEGMKEDITGLLGIVEIGCGHMDAIGTTAPHLDEMFSIGAHGGVWANSCGFSEYYDAWLNGLITAYIDLVGLTSGGVRMQPIRSLETTAQWTAVDRLCSLRAIDRPPINSGAERNESTAVQLEKFESLAPIDLPRMDWAAG